MVVSCLTSRSNSRIAGARVQSDQRKSCNAERVSVLDHSGDVSFPGTARAPRLNLSVAVGISVHRNVNTVGSSCARACRRAVTLCPFAPDLVAGTQFGVGQGRRGGKYAFE